MNFEKLVARFLPTLLAVLVLLAFAGIVVLASSPARAAVGPRPDTGTHPLSSVPNRGAVAAAQLAVPNVSAGPTLNEPPRCRLDVTQQTYREGDTVRASLHLANPAPATLQVEMKIWFSAPGEPPLSLANPDESGRPLELPGMLNRDSGNLRLFAVDESTPRGTYEMSCRLIDPVTGALLSEDLNAFQVY